MPSSLSGSTVLQASGTVLVRSAGTETVLLDQASEEFFGLDGVGARLFELLSEPSTIDTVADVLVEEYDVERAVLASDLLGLASELVERGLVVVHD
ncbi:PqqD family protein [Aeromicrobium sp. NPDC092404]|uniref:PqqD family protein n=1 Tax=Aeromicrobium sp. NPDC092404 TaxID=3154976 RepID=UPI0034186B00